MDELIFYLLTIAWIVAEVVAFEYKRKEGRKAENEERDDE